MTPTPHPDPRAPRSEPRAPHPEPSAPRSEPRTPRPDPSALHPDPPAPRPEPRAPRPDPSALHSDPSAPRSEPRGSRSEPFAVEGLGTVLTAGLLEVSPATLDRVRSELAIVGAEPTAERVAAALRADGGVYGDAVVLAVVAALRQDTFGAGPLEVLLAQPGISDIVVNGPDQVYVDRGAGLERVRLGTGDERSLRRLATRLAALAGRRLDDSAPYVDVRLKDGTRFHAVLAPVAAPGTCLSLRIPSRRVFTLDDLVATGSLPPAGVTVLRDLVESRLAFLISGGTGTGKTTLLNTLLSLVPPTERVVVVEDASELRPDHPHLIRLEARPPNVEGTGEITLRDLVRQALRMRPDRLVVGEVRGVEVVDLLSALNTGHEGGCGTIHANSAADVPARLEALGALAGLSRDAVHAQVSSALHAVVHLERARDGRRRIAEIRLLDQLPDGRVVTSPAVEFDADDKVKLTTAAHRFTHLLAGAG